MMAKHSLKQLDEFFKLKATSEKVMVELKRPRGKFYYVRSQISKLIEKSELLQLDVTKGHEMN